MNQISIYSSFFVPCSLFIIYYGAVGDSTCIGDRSRYRSYSATKLCAEPQRGIRSITQPVINGGEAGNKIFSPQILKFVTFSPNY
jgi:hypothetical protein